MTFSFCFFPVLFFYVDLASEEIKAHTSILAKQPMLLNVIQSFNLVFPLFVLLFFSIKTVGQVITVAVSVGFFAASCVRFRPLSSLFLFRFCFSLGFVFV